MSVGVRIRPKTPVRSSPPGTNKPGALHSRLSSSERLLVGWEVFISICGLAGGIYMASHPLTAMPMQYLQGTWFHTWRWPGLALFFFVGVCPALVVAATVLHRRVATIGHICVGAGLVAWILLEATWIVVSPVLQILVGAIGVTILVTGLREVIGHRPAS